MKKTDRKSRRQNTLSLVKNLIERRYRITLRPVQMAKARLNGSKPSGVKKSKVAGGYNDSGDAYSGAPERMDCAICQKTKKSLPSILKFYMITHNE